MRKIRDVLEASARCIRIDFSAGGSFYIYGFGRDTSAVAHHGETSLHEEDEVSGEKHERSVH